MNPVKDTYERYLREEKCMVERSVRDYLTAYDLLSQRLAPLNGNSYKKINDAIRDMKDGLNWSQATVYKYAVCIKNFYKWAHREEYIPHNPYPYTDWKKAKPKTPRFLTPNQFKSIVNDPFLSHQDLTLLYVFWDSAGRLSEVEHLIQDDFFFDQKFYLDDDEKVEMTGHYVRIPYEISKGSYSFRNVPITDTCKDLILRQFVFVRDRGHKKHIFLNSSNGNLTNDGISKIIHNIGMRKSPFRDMMNLSAHMFRHSFGIRMLEKGIPETIIQKLLGHDTLQMTSRYINMTSQNSLRIFHSRNVA